MNTILPSFNIFIVCNQIFLSEDQRCYFAKNNQDYLFRDVREYKIQDIVGSNKVDIESHSLVSGWMWYLQRSDIKKRNQWSNYSNTPFGDEINEGAFNINGVTNSECRLQVPLRGLVNEIIWQPPYNPQNIREILVEWGLFFNSTVREFQLDNGILAWVDIYSRSEGSGIEGTYYYNFCLNTSPFIYQPSGAVNLSAFNSINWQFKLNPTGRKIQLPSEVSLFYDQPKIVGRVSCDPISNDENNPVVTRMEPKNLFLWTYTLHIMEERYNILTIKNGVASLAFARTI